MNESRPTPLPNFFLAGAPKAGTTSLYRYLDQHPQIYMSPIKEPHYLADEIRFESFSDGFKKLARPRLKEMRRYLDGPVTEKFSGGHIAEWRDYLKLFSGATNEIAIGEASICYLWSASAPANIARLFPAAKILMVLRDPADRAFAQYLHMLSFAKRPVLLRDHINASQAAPAKQISELHPFLEFGLYCAQIRRYFDLFPRGQIHIGFYQDYLRDPVTFIGEIYRFLGVDPTFAPDMSEKHMQAAVPNCYLVNRWAKRLGIWDLARRTAPADLRRRLRRLAFRQRNAMTLSRDDRAWLVDYYRKDIQNLSCLLGRNLTAWLDRDPARRSIR